MKRPEAPSLADLVRTGLPKLQTGANRATQALLAEKIEMADSVLSKTLGGARACSDIEAVRIADALHLPAKEVLLAASALRCKSRAKDTVREAEKARIAEERLRRHAAGPTKGQRSGPGASPEGKLDGKQADEALWRRAAEYYEELQRGLPAEALKQPPPSERHAGITLEDFPRLCGSKWTVIAGDRREGQPKGRGDLMALSVSATDFMFIAGLELPKDTLVLSDKIIRVASDDNLRQLLGSGNILLIGSPAVNLMTRKMMSDCGATMMFNIAERWYHLEQQVYGTLKETVFLDDELLKSKLRETREDTAAILPNYMKSGFVDPIDFKGIRGVARPRTRDYGIVALAPNPWSDAHVTCICAGVGGGGTAGALKLLGTPGESFNGHPWGGVFKVNLHDQIAWENRFGYLQPQWDTKDYTMARYITELKSLVEKVRGRQTKGGRHDESVSDLQVSESLLDKMLSLAERLANAPLVSQPTA